LEVEEYESLIGPDTEIHKEHPKLVQFKIKVPENFNGDFNFFLENKDFAAGKHIDFCSIGK
jgi:hypothetical protein